MDYIAATILILGIYYTGRGKWWGWLISTLATLIWAYIGIVNVLYGMSIMNLIITGINIKNMLNWKRKDNEQITRSVR